MGLATAGRTLCVVAFYVGLALFAMRVVLPAPASTVALPVDIPRPWQQISGSDQKLTIALIAGNARALTRAPATLLDGPQCFPLRRAITLGEHAFGLGLLAVVPYLLSGGDPILTYNIVAIATLVLAGLGMYILVRSWTGSTAAALVAGTLFAIHPMRLGNLQHLYAGTTYWTPLALLATERFFTLRSWTAAAGMALFVGLQMLESIYPLIALALIGGTYGGWALLRHRRVLPALVVPLGAAGVAIGLTATMLFEPYLATRELWGTLGGRATVLLAPAAFAPGGSAFVGVILGLLAVIAVLDRLRGARPEWAGDPRLPLLVAAALVAWAALDSIGIPGIATRVPSLFALAARVVPAFDALRGGGVIASGVTLVATILAGFGVAALIRGRRPVVQWTMAALVGGAALAEVFVPGLARASFGSSMTLQARSIRPLAALIALYGTPEDGGVLDLPYAFTRGRFASMGDYVLLASFHHRPAATCYNSFHVALQDEIAARAARVFDDPREAEALAALGIRDVVVHQWNAGGVVTTTIPAVVPAHLREVGRVFGHVRYALAAPGAVTGDWTGLAAGAAARSAADVPPLRVAAGAAAIEVWVANRGTATYRRPDPIAPMPLVARWRDAAGDVVREDRVTRYLPATLAIGEERTQRVALTVPTTGGRYQLTLAPADQPELVIATQTVEVAS